MYFTQHAASSPIRLQPRYQPAFKPPRHTITMPPKRMTANPVKPARYRAGKPVGPESSSESESSDGEAEDQQTTKKRPQPRKIAPPPKAASAGRIISTGGGKINYRDEEEARRAAAAKARVEAERRAREEGFVTEDEEDEEEDDDDKRRGGTGVSTGAAAESGSEEESSEEESSSEEEAPRRLMIRPKFIRKGERDGDRGESKSAASAVTGGTQNAPDDEAAEAARKKAALDEMVEEQIKKDLAARSAGKKHWDDDSDPEDEVDDTDDLDPEAEQAAWKLRELKRIRRDREAIEAKEAEREEVERRRNLTEDERRAEDDAFLAKQKEEKDGRGSMAYMQKYYHKGAFYREEAEAEGLDKRDVMGMRFADDVQNRELLPQALQMRDMTKLGKKGATKYRDLKSEDTGRWGELDSGRPRGGYDRFGDERFQPDRDGGWGRNQGGDGGKGANAIPLGERKSVPGAPEGPRNDRSRGEDRHRDGERYRPRGEDRERRGSRSRSPRRDHRDHRDQDRDRDEYRDHRKRESSRERDRHEGDKRRRIDA